MSVEVEIIRNMPDKEYRAREERSQSDFKNFREPTPAHALHKMKKAKEDSDSMLAGTCLHALLLEGKKIWSVDKGRKTKTNPDQPSTGILLSPWYDEVVRGMEAGVRRNAGAMAIINARMEAEVSIFWAGMKARLDIVFPVGVGDLKSTKGASLREFQKAIVEYGYYIQAAHYLEAAALAGFPADDFYIIAVENFEPYECALWKMDHDAIEIGRKELDVLKENFYRCQSSGIYPGYPQEPITISLPSWKMREHNIIVEEF
jgi:hypothetical protein